MPRREEETWSCFFFLIRHPEQGSCTESESAEAYLELQFPRSAITGNVIVITMIT